MNELYTQLITRKGKNGNLKIQQPSFLKFAFYLPKVVNISWKARYTYMSNRSDRPKAQYTLIKTNLLIVFWSGTGKNLIRLHQEKQSDSIATKEMGLDFNIKLVLKDADFTRFFLFIRTSKFWPSLVLKFWHNSRLNCP